MVFNTHIKFKKFDYKTIELTLNSVVVDTYSKYLIDAEAELTKILSENIAGEIDRENLDTLRYNQLSTTTNERRVFKIPVGNIPENEIDDYIRRITNKFKRNT